MSSRVVCGIVDHLEEEPEGPPVAAGPIGAPRPTTVVFREGSRVRVRGEEPDARRRVDVLNRLRDFGRPALVRVTEDDSVETVRIPVVGRVTEVQEIEDGGLSIEMETSSARRVLTRELVTPAARTLLERSQREGILLSLSGDPLNHAVQWLDEAPGEAAPLFPALARAADRPIRLDDVGEVDEADAADLFDAMLGTSCDLQARASGCIPFLYPDDGCFSRAHEMCRLIAAQGVEPGKLWLFGALAPSTPNDPDCRADWSFHVAPVVRLRGTRKLVVIDPSLFNAPVSRTRFVAAMNAPNVAQILTSSDIFLRTKRGDARLENPPSGGRTETEEWLEIHRIELRERVPSPPFRCR